MSDIFPCQIFPMIFSLVSWDEIKYNLISRSAIQTAVALTAPLKPVVIIIIIIVIVIIVIIAIVIGLQPFCRISFKTGGNFK